MPEAILVLGHCRSKQAALSQRPGEAKPTSSTTYADRDMGEQGRCYFRKCGVTETQRKSGSGGDF